MTDAAAQAAYEAGGYVGWDGRPDVHAHWQRIADAARQAEPRVSGEVERRNLAAELIRLHENARGCEFDLVPADGPIARLALFMHDHGDTIAAALASPASAADVPAGWRMVPVEPTEAMIAAWTNAAPGYGGESFTDDEANKLWATAHWSAMLSVSPPPPATPGHSSDVRDMVAAERERCARIAEKRLRSIGEAHYAERIAAAIRSGEGA